MRKIALTLAFIALASPAGASDCQTALAAIDAATTTKAVAEAAAQLAPETKAFLDEQAADSVDESKDWARRILAKKGCA
jgi:hypothetical protein